MRYLDRAVTDSGGIALRYGGFYGAANDGLVEPVRKRQFPIVGNGGGVWSFIHVDDAAAATVLALEHGSPGIYNIVDDEPASIRGLAPCARRHSPRQAAPPGAGVARAACRGRGRRDDGNGGARRV
jgi:nucleoside-diphosphate-sugar epimerase